MAKGLMIAIGPAKGAKGRGARDKAPPEPSFADAAGEDDEDDDEDFASPDSEHRAAFNEWMQAIRDGDDDAAWEAYQECLQLKGY